MIFPRAIRDGDDGVLIERRFHIVQFAQRIRRLLIGAFAVRDVGANGDVLHRLSVRIQVRHDGRVHPVERAVLRLVLDFPLPHSPGADRLPDAANELLGMKTGIDDAMVLAEQLLARIFGNRAELVVHVGDFPFRVRDGDDGVLIDGRLEIVQFPQGIRRVFIRLPALRDIRMHQQPFIHSAVRA